MLRPGGVFRLVAPDMSLFYDAYQRGDELLFKSGLQLYDCRSLEQKLLLQFASSQVCTHPMACQHQCSDDEIRSVISSKPRDDFFEYFKSRISFENQSQHPADHINWFTPEKTKRKLDVSGFSCVNRSAYGQSQLPIMRNIRLFDPYYDHSLYFECVK